jgi:hypothetical protein
MSLCECGCGKNCNKKFAKGHWNKGLTKKTDERVAKNSLNISKSLKEGFDTGRIIKWQLGLTKETDSRIAKTSNTLKEGYRTGRVISSFTGKSWCRGLTKETDDRVAIRASKLIGHPKWNNNPAWNKNLTKETDQRVKSTSDKLKGRPSYRKGKTYDKLYGVEKGREIATRIGKTNSVVLKGHIGWNRGLTKETDARIARIAEGHTGLKGELSSGWKGGLSFIKYPQSFNSNLKNNICKRDNYTCQLCGVPEYKLTRKIDIHHIDYNKKNCSEVNLISLCRKCNSKVNGNREYWQKYFIKINQGKVN